MKKLVTLASMLVLASSAAAHIFWIQPDKFRPAKNDLVKIDLRVGEAPPGEAKARDNQRIVEFKAYSASGDHELIGFDGRAPAAADRFAQEGPVILTYRSTNAFIELEKAKFDQYVKDEGLTTIVEARKNAPDGAVREAYSRSVKALVNVGGKPGPGFDRVVGLDLEVVPLTDPAPAKPGDEMKFKILWKGAPASNQRVSLHHQGHKRVDARTNESGAVSFTPDEPGVWIVETLEMHDAPKDVKARYQSVWGSLSFEIAPPAPDAKQPTAP
ncbi:MAG: DUF4198 domain-containing protein [Planctomycetes bacterium]|nr:DUF4198 domain-containing protein [Planctomycetota bacterium]